MQQLQAFLRKPFSGWQYAFWGFTLMLFKYGAELLLIWLNGGEIYGPLAFIMPFNSLRVQAIAGAPQWVTWFILLWSVPFVFCALLLSVRRVVDIGLNPWLAMWILCPFVNLFFMGAMCLAQTQEPKIEKAIRRLEPLEPKCLDTAEDDIPIEPNLVKEIDPVETQESANYESTTTVLNTIGTMVAGLGITIMLLLASIYFLGEYGASIFFSAPILLGVICGYTQTHQTRNAHTSGAMAAIGVACGSILLGCGLLVVLAFEGVICILMALPIMLPAAAVGGLVGHLIAISTTARGPSWMVILVLMPTSTAIEHALTRPTMFEVVSVVEVDAPPEKVWQQVVAFPDITSPPGLLFQLGVAYPIRARIEGTGPGAVRYCEFSTGDFVEPITTWNPPHHLAFSVEQQPCPLTELSPYEEIHPPHLDGFLRSHQGEFRLFELPSGRTKLEGHTWYSVDMYPQLYWKVWTDSIIHTIHYRVLDHIRTVSEANEANEAKRPAEQN